MFEGFESRFKKTVMISELDKLSPTFIIAAKIEDEIQFGIYDGEREGTELVVSDLLTIKRGKGAAVKLGRASIFAVRGVRQRPVDLFVLTPEDIEWVIKEVEEAGLGYDASISNLVTRYKSIIDLY